MAKPDAPRPAVFLDRDGVLNRDLGYVFRPQDLEVLPGVPEALAALRSAGYLLVVVSNQSGVARGYYGDADVARFNALLRDQLLASGGVAPDDFLHCPHGPDSTCACRKPAPGMILDAARRHGIDLARSWMVGDKRSDVESGLAAGVRAIQIARPDEAQHPRAAAHAASLAEAARYVLASQPA